MHMLETSGHWPAQYFIPSNPFSPNRPGHWGFPTTQRAQELHWWTSVDLRHQFLRHLWAWLCPLVLTDSLLLQLHLLLQGFHCKLSGASGEERALQTFGANSAFVSSKALTQERCSVGCWRLLAEGWCRRDAVHEHCQCQLGFGRSSPL